MPGDNGTAYVLDLTSQTWRSEKELDRPVWKHWLTIIKPKEVKSDTAFLYITGGNNNSKPPAQPDAALRQMAAETGTVIAELRMVPNQPITFPGEQKGRTEDAFIAYTWDKYLRGGDDLWPARLPMTKSAVRAMDAVTQFLAADAGGKTTISKYVVAGGSKRGWTTWTTAAVDKRVVAIVPLVIDMLNVEKSFEHHWKVYGFWAPAVGDYQEMKIMEWTGSPEYRALMKIEEPYEYRDRLTMPKMIINAAGDQFFLPDSSQFYFDDLKGEKHVRYVPNADHSLRNSDARETMVAFYDAVINNRPRPSYSWKIEKDGTIRVKTKTQPTEVKLWQATNPEARDFRLEKIGPAYKSSVLEAKNGEYTARVPKPEKGYTAYFVEMTYPSGGKYPIKVTSGVKIMPDVEPFPAYKPVHPKAAAATASR